ncbi:MAG: tol-pal system protein YbgF [Gallionella sp.]
MLKQRALLLLALCFVIPAQAGLLEDDEARKQIQQLETRVLKLEDAVKQQTKSMLDLQSQIDALNTEIRNLRGQNEETNHGLQDAEKRQKDFYVDLDTRLRHFESAEEAAKEATAAAAKAPVAPVSIDSSDPVPEDRAFEAAYGLYKSGSSANAAKAFQDFIKKFPDSVHAPNANYWLGNAQFAMKDYKGALATYQGLLRDFPEMPKSADVLYGIAVCQQGLKRPIAAKKTFKQLIAKYPSSEAASKAKKKLAAAR